MLGHVIKMCWLVTCACRLVQTDQKLLSHKITQEPCRSKVLNLKQSSPMRPLKGLANMS